MAAKKDVKWAFPHQGNQGIQGVVDAVGLRAFLENVRGQVLDRFGDPAG
jgi:hypothetical protein